MRHDNAVCEDVAGKTIPERVVSNSVGDDLLFETPLSVSEHTGIAVDPGSCVLCFR